MITNFKIYETTSKISWEMLDAVECGKLDKLNSGDYYYHYHGHVFVFAKPIGGWENYLNNRTFHNDEFVPCMINGYGDGQRLWFIGDVQAHPLKKFEIIPFEEGSAKYIVDRDKEVGEVKFDRDVKKYNL